MIPWKILQKNCVFIIFIYYFDEVSNFRNSINRSKIEIGDEGC